VDVLRRDIRKEYREKVLLRDGRNEKRTRSTTHQGLKVSLVFGRMFFSSYIDDLYIAFEPFANTT
jgi:hypothetical protein